MTAPPRPDIDAIEARLTGVTDPCVDHPERDERRLGWEAFFPADTAHIVPWQEFGGGYVPQAHEAIVWARYPLPGGGRASSPIAVCALKDIGLQNRANATLFARAPYDLADCCAYIRRLEAEIARLQAGSVRLNFIGEPPAMPIGDDEPEDSA